MKELGDYKRLNYRMVIEYHPEGGVYFVKFPELPGCIADGETLEKALKNGLAVKNEWLRVAIASGWTIPEPMVPPETSGRVTLRLPKSVHERLVDRAEMENVSLNQMILTYVSAGLERSDLESKLTLLQQEFSAQLNRVEETVCNARLKDTDTLQRLTWGVAGLWSRILATKQRNESLADNQYCPGRSVQLITEEAMQ